MNQRTPNRSKPFTYKPVSLFKALLPADKNRYQLKWNKMSFASDSPVSKLAFSFFHSVHMAECWEDEHTFLVPINLSWHLKPNEAELITHAEATHNWGAFYSQNILYSSLPMSRAALKSKHLHADKAKSLCWLQSSYIPKVLKTEGENLLCFSSRE